MKKKNIKKESKKKTEIAKTIEESEKEIKDVTGIKRIKDILKSIPKDSEREKKIKKLRGK